jgi:organic radical activating enzyme
MKKPLQLPYVEFYITNVCNLACDGCNRFNSFKFKGWQSWKDHSDDYAKWSEQLDIGSISIMGGEPLLNPDFYQWVYGLGKLWPKTPIMIATNGTQLDHHQQLYDVMLDNRYVTMNVSLHNKMHKKVIVDKVKQFLCEPFVYRADTTKYRESLSITDTNGITVKIFYNWWFHQGAVIRSAESNRYTLHNSDPIKAHDICHSKTCHHFEHGKLYKCGPAALFEQFDKQFGLDLSLEDRNLISSVPFVAVDDDIDIKKIFINKITAPIPQCKFCPEHYDGKMIFALEKKDL